MKIIKLILLLFIFTQSYSQSNSIEEVTIKLVAPTYGFIGRDSVKYFNMFYSNYGFKTTINDTCFFLALQKEISNLKQSESFFMHSWMALEVYYKNKKCDTIYMNYYCIGYYYNNNSMQYSRSFTKLIYEQLININDENIFIYTGNKQIIEDNYRYRIYQEIKRLDCY